jgi:hypothetical protein
VLYPLSYEGVESNVVLAGLEVYIERAVDALRRETTIPVARASGIVMDLGCLTGLEPVTTGSTDQCSAN